MTTRDATGLIRIERETSCGGQSLTERLLRQGIIMVSGMIDESASHALMLQLLAISDEDPQRNITLYVNSPGGGVYDGLAMIDLCRLVPNPITTIGTGCCASMGAMLLTCAAPRGKRKVMPNCELMLHQPLSGVQGQASDIAIEAVHVVRLRERLYGMIAEVTGQPVGKVTRDFDRNRWMTAKEALAYGLIDEIVTPSPIDLSEYKGRIPMSVRLAGFVTGE